MTFFLGFEASSANEAEKLGHALTLLDSRGMDLSSFDFAVDQIRSNYKYNESVTKSLLQLSYSKEPQSVREWIKDLPAIITSAKVNLSHLEAIKSLLKRRDELLISSFRPLSSVPNDHSKILDHVWRTLALCPELNIPREVMYRSLQRVSESTRQFVVCNSINK